ncbi:MAG: hypothetical protein J4F42_12390 [Desulfurellaceae bacterium]|nr:hypothetical protein [Desulfurellaceae bacterium]
MEKLIEISNKAVADYGFRQIVQWSPDDIVAQWQLSDREAELLTGVIKDELDRLPIPVEPPQVLQEQERVAGVIRQALG